MCDVVDKDFARQLEIELAISLENQCKAQAEVERLNNTLENTRISRATIIEDRNLLDQELAASKAEVKEIRAALGDDLLEWKISNCTLSAEVERLKAQLSLSTPSSL
jgi:multidrug resistance efflux pump